MTSVLLVHGLNNSPFVMNALADELSRYGYSCTCLRLEGHDPGQMWPRSAYGRWIKQIEETSADFFVGFSLGSVLALSMSARWQKAVFFSPPLFLTPAGSVLDRILPRWPLPIPSFAPAEIRAKKWNSSLAYHGLFDAIRNCQDQNIAGHLIIGDANDRLLDWAKAQQRFPDNEFLEIRCQHPSRHITTRPEYMSLAEWHRVRDAILAHFKRA